MVLGRNGVLMLAGLTMLVVGAAALWLRRAGRGRWAALALAPLGLGAGGVVGVALTVKDNYLHRDPSARTVATLPSHRVSFGAVGNVADWDVTVEAPPEQRGEQVVVELRLRNRGLEAEFPARLGLALVRGNGARYPVELIDCDVPDELPFTRELASGA